MTRFLLLVPAFLLASVDGHAQSTPRAMLPQDLSPWGMVSHADIIVQMVMGGLALASVLTWTIALAKIFELIGAGRQARKGLARLAGARDLAEAASSLSAEQGPCATLARAAAAEL
ncbi:MAG: exbB, partial [Rubritepida sp.]|nr:exbB [Rubritepida sp.]